MESYTGSIKFTTEISLREMSISDTRIIIANGRVRILRSIGRGELELLTRIIVGREITKRLDR